MSDCIIVIYQPSKLSCIHSSLSSRRRHHRDAGETQKRVWAAGVVVELQPQQVLHQV